MRKREPRNIFNLQSAKRIIHKVNEIMANENNGHHSEALPLLLRPDASGAGSGGKRLG